MIKTFNAKSIFSIILLIFIVSLIPLYLIGAYAHPSVDDYFYGVETAQVWEATHSIAEVLKTSFEEMIQTYHDWQGTFSAIFLMRLQPAIFGEEFYLLAPVILLTTYVLSSVFFYVTMLKTFFHAKRYTAGIISLCITFVSMQLTHTPSDSFYWYNGAIYYTFFYSLMLVLFSLMAKLWKGSSSKVSAGRFVHTSLFSVLLAFVIGGGNYPTALMTAIILTLVLFCVVFLVAKRRCRSIITLLLSYILIAAAFFSGFILSLTAPGNAIRQASVGGSTGLLKTFLYTFAYGGYSLSDLLSAPCIVFFVALVPALYSVAKRSPCSFRCPLVVFIFTFGLYCSMGTPVFYAQGLRMPYRIMNIIYFSGYGFILFNLLYFLGWLSRKYGHLKIITATETCLTAIKTDKKKLFAAFCLCLALFSVTCVGLIELNESEQNSGHVEVSNLPMSASAVYSLVTGEACSYDCELDARADHLSSTEETQVAISPLSVYPELIFHTEITSDAGHWKNSHLALYYGKDEVWLEE